MMPDLVASARDAARVLREVAALQEELAARLHYPQCWDTVAYPTLADALREVADCSCSTCKREPERPSVERYPIHKHEPGSWP